MFKENFDFIFSLILVQFIFNNILIINIIKNIIIYKFKNLFTMVLEHLFTVINIGYNKYRFDKIDSDIDELKNDNTKFKINFENINNNIDELKNDNKNLNNKLDLILELIKNQKENSEN